MRMAQFVVLGRRSLTALLLTAPFSTAAQEKAPQAFIESIYRPYQIKGFKGQPYWQPTSFFAPDLAAAIEHDMTLAKQRGEPPALDGDPFVDAQDWEISDLTITTSVAGDRALATVVFKNLGEPRTLKVLLVQSPQGWRISDIVSANTSLRALYKLR